MNVPVGRNIRPETMIKQWTTQVHRFQLHLWNFETAAAKAAVKVFQGSFDMRRFNTSGSSPWPERKRRVNHPILEETGTLKNSIVWKRMESGRITQTMSIFTDPSKFGKAKRHTGANCYAAIHNSPQGGESSNIRWGRAANIQQRQFMGPSSVLDEQLHALASKIFIGFP